MFLYWYLCFIFCVLLLVFFISAVGLCDLLNLLMRFYFCCYSFLFAVVILELLLCVICCCAFFYLLLCFVRYCVISFCRVLLLFVFEFC